MGFFDTFHFDKDEYYGEHCELSAYALRKKHHQKVMLLTMTTGGVAIGVGGAMLTGGLSLLSAGYSGRQHSVANQQKKVLEKIMTERGIEIPRQRKRDVAGGAAIAVASLGLGVGTHEVCLLID